MSMSDSLQIADRTLGSRLFCGTGKFASGEQMREALAATGTELATVAFKRVNLGERPDPITGFLDADRYALLPNTSGARTAEEAVFVARMAREALGTNWLKLEIHPDPKYLMPDPVETLKAAEELVRLGFVVLPYVHADPVLCKRLEEAGTAAVMPLGAPIGTNKGLCTRDFLKIIFEQSSVPVVVDAGIGGPGHAAEAMELGADAVLVNTAIAGAGDPAAMGRAFRLAVEAGRLAYRAQLAPMAAAAAATSPLTGFLDSEPA